MRTKQAMICGIDCHPNSTNCNEYRKGKVDQPPEATEEQKIEFIRQQALEALVTAESAWHQYACLLEVGESRLHAFGVCEKLRLLRAKP